MIKGLVAAASKAVLAYLALWRLYEVEYDRRRGPFARLLSVIIRMTGQVVLRCLFRS